jgi:WS/DGAT/MGAT family acyltransferase
VALAPPGDLGQLLSLAAAVVADPLDRSRPLWQFWVIEGLSDGRAALLVKLHHTLTDGMGGVRLWEQFVDVERDGRPDDPRNLSPTPPGEDIGRDRQSPPQMLAGAVETAGRLATSVARRAIDVATDVISHPGRLPSLPGDAARATKSSLDQLVVTDRCRSPLWTGRGGPTHLRVVDADVATTRSAAHLLGGTINDLFVTAVAGAAGRYHRLRGTNVDELRMAMPVSVRHGDGTGGNAFVPTRLLVPTDHGDLATRFAATRSALRPSRSTPVLGLADAVATAVNVLPASAVVHLVRQQTASVDFTTSNVRGAPIPLYVAGSRLDATYPIGPLGGTAFNASMLSYNGTLSIGVHIDGAAVDDPDVLGELINDEFTRLVEAGNQR